MLVMAANRTTPKRLQVDLPERRARVILAALTDRLDMIAGDPADDAELAEAVAWLRYRVTRFYGPERAPAR